MQCRPLMLWGETWVWSADPSFSDPFPWEPVVEPLIPSAASLQTGRPVGERAVRFHFMMSPTLHRVLSVGIVALGVLFVIVVLAASWGWR